MSHRSLYGNCIYTSDKLFGALVYAEPDKDLTQTVLVVDFNKGPTAVGVKNQVSVCITSVICYVYYHFVCFMYRVLLRLQICIINTTHNAGRLRVLQNRSGDFVSNRTTYSA